MSIESFLASDTPITIMKWAAMILITGFIAQFGKKFAEYLIDRLRSKKSAAADTRELPVDSTRRHHPENAPTEDDTTASQGGTAGRSAAGNATDPAETKAREKMLKKAEKARQKELKKREK
jgi:hypothetical protein